MITNYKRKAPSDKELRNFLFSLSTSEYEEIFADCGFPIDDGKRKFLPHEADDKAAFYSDRFWEIVGNSKRWINDSTSPNVFIENFGLCVDTLTKLCFLEKYLIFYAPLPTDQLNQLSKQKADLEIKMLHRAWDSELRKIDKLATEKSREKHLADFFLSFEKLKPQLSKETISRIETLKRQSSQINVQDIAIPEKPKPVFDSANEKKLLSEYKSAEDELERHFARIQLFQFYYKYRHERIYLERCMALCQEDIASLPILDQLTRQKCELAYRNHCRYFTPTKSEKTRHDLEMKKGFIGRIEAFDKLIMIHQNAKEYELAIQYCEAAIKHSKEHLSEFSNYQEKKDRLMRKKEKLKN